MGFGQVGIARSAMAIRLYASMSRKTFGCDRML
jgi:hypothetical protein